MKRGLAYLFVAVVILLSIGVAGVLIWLTEVQHIPRGYVLGPLFLVIGGGFTALNQSVSDEYLRKHFGGAANADRMRDMWRGCWVGIVIGAGMIAAEYFL